MTLTITAQREPKQPPAKPGDRAWRSKKREHPFFDYSAFDDDLFVWVGPFYLHINKES